MKLLILIIALGLVGIAIYGFCKRATPRWLAAGQHSSSSSVESPFACNRSALNSEERQRHTALGPKLRSLRKSVRELPDGYEFEFPSDQKTFQMVSEWVIKERSCCPFFEFGLRLEQEGGPLWVRLSGREGTKDFIQQELPAWLTP